MQKIWMAAASLLLLTGSIAAQKNSDTSNAAKNGAIHQFPKGKHTKNGMHKLQLTDAQKSAAKSLKEDFQKQSAALKNDKNISAEDLKTKTAALRKEQHQKMQSLLTADQQKQMAGNRQKQRDEQRGPKKGNKDKLMSKLDLTSEQQSRMQESRTAMQSKMKAIKEDKSLTEAQKKEQVKNISRQQKENLKSILTPEQLEKMKEGRKAGKRGVKSENVK